MPPLSRTPSTNTVTQSRHLTAESPRQGSTHTYRSSFPPSRKADAPREPPIQGSRNESHASQSSNELSSESPSASDSDSAQHPVRRSQIFRRPPQFANKESALGIFHDGADAEEDDSPDFLPFANTQRSSAQNAIAPSRGGHERTKSAPVVAGPSKEKQKQKQPAESSASSAGSLVPAPSPSQGGDGAQSGQRLRALSPKHRAELAKLSPRQRGLRRDGSDGTPSMGSSFSDLDGKS